MEITDNGNARINDHFDELEIIIPCRRSMGFIGFVALWMIIGIIASISLLQTGNPFKGAPGFFTFWIIAWTWGLCWAIRFLVWRIFGKEIITIGKGRMEIRKQNAWLLRPKTYDLSAIEQFRVYEDCPTDSVPNYKRYNIWTLNRGSMLRFSYGMKTVKFAEDLDLTEAVHIVDLLKEKKLLAHNQFGTPHSLY